MRNSLINLLLRRIILANTISTDRLKTILEGTLPRDISLLSDMELFILPTFKLHGPIEGLFSLWKKVDTIRLSGNQFTGSLPANLDQETPNLRILRLSENRLTGEIPTSLSNLPGLTDLQLDDNQLTGAISPSLVNLGSLSKYTRLNESAKAFVRCRFLQCFPFWPCSETRAANKPIHWQHPSWYFQSR